MGWIADKTTLAVDEVFKRRIDNNPDFTPAMRKFFKWFGYSVIPFIMNVSTIIVMIYLFTKLYNTIGFERTIIILLVLLWAKIQ